MTTELTSFEAQRLARIAEVQEELTGEGIPSYTFADGHLHTPNGAQILSKFIDVVILADPWSVTVFADVYKDGVSTPPIATAMALRYDQLVFSSDSREDYANMKCADHPSCQFASGYNGKSKLAREKRKLIFIPADKARGDIEDLTEDDFLTLSIPPTTLKPYAKYLKSLPSSAYVTDFITRIRVNPTENKKLDFIMLDQLTTGLDVLWGLAQQAEAKALATMPLRREEDESTKTKKY